MIDDIEDYFAKGCGRCGRFATSACSAQRWAEGLATLRGICRSAGLEETVKWGHPCYMHAGRNIVILGAFRGDFRLSFFDAALLRDPTGILERQGPNTRHADAIRFTSNSGPEARAEVIRACLAEAMDHAKNGRRPAPARDIPEMPKELADALDGDPVLGEAFHALTPGRQKSYILNLRGARSAETRIRRIAGFRGRILAGKGATER